MIWSRFGIHWAAIMCFCCIVSAQESPRGLFIIDVDGGVRKEISPRADLCYGSACYSNSGDHLAFDAWPVTGHFGNTQIYVMTTDGQNLKELGSGAFPSWSPDDKQIIFRTQTALSMVVVNRDGTGREELSVGGNSPRWSPDGRHIAFLDARTSAISVYDAARGRTVSVRRGALRPFWGGCWSLDGMSYCFPAASQAPVPDSLVIVEFDPDIAVRNETVRFSGPEIGTNMSWSHQGDRILFFSRLTEQDTFQLYVIDARGKGAPEWVAGQDRNRTNTDPAWSPSGKQIVFSSSSQQRTALGVERTP